MNTVNTAKYLTDYDARHIKTNKNKQTVPIQVPTKNIERERQLVITAKKTYRTKILLVTV